MNHFAKRLKLKAESGGRGLPIADMLERANHAIQTLRSDFERIKDDKLAEISALARALRGSTSLDLQVVERLSSKVYDLKRQSSAFGFAMLTEIGEQFCHFLSFLLTDQGVQGRPLETVAEALDAHVVALVAAAQLGACKPPAGSAALSDELRELAQRFRKSAGECWHIGL